MDRATARPVRGLATIPCRGLSTLCFLEGPAVLFFLKRKRKKREQKGGKKRKQKKMGKKGKRKKRRGLWTWKGTLESKKKIE